MKKQILIWICLLGILPTTLLGQQTFNEKYFKEGMYIFDDIQKIKSDELFTVYKSEFGLGTNDEMRRTNHEVLENGMFRDKYELFHNGIPVQGSMMNVLGDKGIVQRINGFWVKGLNFNTTSVVSEQTAIQAAISFVGSTQYIWENTELENILKDETGDPNATRFPTAKLIITNKRGVENPHALVNYQLCYLVNITSIEPSQKTDIYVNAQTGVVFTSQNPIIEAYTVTGCLWTAHNGWHNDLKTRKCSGCTNFWLHDNDRHISTTHSSYLFGAKNSYNKDQNNNWVEGDTKTAASAHWSIGKSWDYYINRHGRWGTDYNGRDVHIMTHNPILAQYGANAAFDPTNVNEDDLWVRPDNSNGHSAAMLDVMAHEYTHAMVRASSNLGSNGDFDARSINEGLADIFGMRIEGYTNGGNHDWTFAENMGTYQRNFVDPSTDFPSPSPSTYQGANWTNNSVHNNGGVMRRYFELLSNGGSLNNIGVSPLGIEKADDITYIAFNWWYWSNLRYPEAASQTVNAAVYHWGNCSDEHMQTARAMRAVGFNNVSIPLCKTISLEGPQVIDALVANLDPISFSVDLNEITNTEGTFSWNIPLGWQATINGNSISVTNFDNFESKELSVNYTEPNGTVHTDKLFIHFSQEDWSPTNNTAQNKRSESTLTSQIEPHIALFPNPVNNKLNVVLPNQNGSIRISDLTGKLIQSVLIDDFATSIDVTKIPNGIYIIDVRSKDLKRIEKISIVH